MSNVFYGSRLKQVRELMGFTQTELAKKLEKTQAAIAKIESDFTKPSEDTIEKLSSLTGFQPPFFYAPPLDDYPLGSLFFRKRQSVSTKKTNEIHKWGLTIFEIFKRLLEDINPDIKTNISPFADKSPKLAARLLREAFGVSPEAPIKNLTKILETNGVFLFSIPVAYDRFDAFSLWTNNKKSPVIAILATEPVDRLRFSIAHELGHLALHQNTADLADKDSELKADLFASEFLLPEESISTVLRSNITLTSLIQLKPKWGVSIQALIKRAENLGIISKRKSQYMFTQLSKRGWRKKEPASETIPKEKPRLLAQLAEMRYGVPINFSKMAQDFSINAHLLKSIFNGYSCRQDSPNQSSGKVLQGEFGNQISMLRKDQIVS